MIGLTDEEIPDPEGPEDFDCNGKYGCGFEGCPSCDPDYYYDRWVDQQAEDGIL